MSGQDFSKKIEEIKSSIIAIGFRISQDKVNIIGSGFFVSDNGKVLSAAHLLNKLTPEQKNSLVGMTMIEKLAKDSERYGWFPLKEIKIDVKNDIALFQIENYQKTLLKPLKLNNSDDVKIGHEVYFIGFPYAAQLMNDGFGITLIVNKGIISNIKRDGVDNNHPRNWFIVDAISNPGNSGCPLIDMKTNKVIGIMTISFRTQSQTNKDLDIREPMHIAGAKPINLAKLLF